MLSILNMKDERRKYSSKVNELSEYMGLWICKSDLIKNVADARRAFLDYYYQENATQQDRLAWQDYGPTTLERIEDGEIQEATICECNRCNLSQIVEEGETTCWECTDTWETVDLDESTRQNIFVLYNEL